MTTILLDHDSEGERERLLGALRKLGWLSLVPIEIVTFAEVGLNRKSNDREVWRFAQARRMLLLTNNRNADDPNSLELTLRQELTADSLPVLTFGNRDRLKETEYCEQCATRLVEIILDLPTRLGSPRFFIP